MNKAVIAIIVLVLLIGAGYFYYASLNGNSGLPFVGGDDLTPPALPE